MKARGEFRARKDILTKDGQFKNVASTQKGQQLILDEALRIVEDVEDWINNQSSKTYRSDLKDYFVDQEIIIQKIVECFLFMSGSISAESKTNTAKKSRHKRVNSINTKIIPELSFDNTWRFLEVIISMSKYFNVTNTIERDMKGNYNNTIKYECNLSPTIIEEINMLAVSSFYPLPMETPPIDWEYIPSKIEGEEGTIKGGYETYQYEMVRSRGRSVDYTKFSQNIFDAANYIQRVPWVVNEEVLEQLKKDLKLPKKEDYIKVTYPSTDLSEWDLDLTDESLNIQKEKRDKILKHREEFKEAAALYNAEKTDYDSAVGKYRYAKLACQIADNYKKKVIYFPHNYDSRGRIYPIPIGLSPQGSDAIKALLLYNNLEEITDTGLSWCWAYLASLYGDDKLDFPERVIRGKELIDTNYLEADEPYQFLSHQLELKKYLADPTYKMSVRIHLDACNSGSQFTSAITNDLDGCLATNVIPTINEDGSQIRQDAYMLVAEKSIHLAQEMYTQEKDIKKKGVIGFLKSLLKKDGRKICKRPVMVSNYGGTAGGRANMLWHMLRELGADRKWITQRNANIFGKIIGDSITGVLNGGKAFEIYIHKMNNVIARDNQPITWDTSDGFHVVHSKNKELKPKIVRCLLPNSRRQLSISKKSYSKNLSATKMKSAISPNYIHSLDAELLRRTALKMRDLGIMDTDWIHDSFGAHPNHIDTLLSITKEVFLEMMLARPIDLLDSQLRAQVTNDSKKVQKELDSIVVPDLGKGERLPLELVRKSNWFFS